MIEDQFEEFFRNKLLNYSSEVSGNMWERIKHRKDKERKIFFLRWPFALIAVSILLGGYFIFNTKSNSGHDKISNLISKQKIEKNDITKLPESKVDGSTSLNQNSKNIKTKSNRISSKKFDATENNKSDIYPDRQQNKKSKTSRATRSSINIDINNGSDSLIDNGKTVMNTVDENVDTLNSKKKIKVPVPKDSSSKKILTQSQNKKENKPSTAKNKKWSIDVYASPDLPFFEITPGKASVVDYIKKIHKPQPSFTVGVRVGKYFTKNFSIKTGFQYSQINEKFPDSGFLNTVDHYKSIDIPILIGYDITHADFKTTINAGVIFNLYSWYKGITIDSTGTTDINYSNIFKRNTGISLYAGVSLAKPINNKLELFTEPYFRYRVSYMTKPQAPFKQKINIAGISFGLKYNF